MDYLRAWCNYKCCTKQDVTVNQKVIINEKGNR